MAKPETRPKTAKPKTARSTSDGKRGNRRAGAAALSFILVGLLLIAAGINNVAVTVLHVQLIAPGAFTVQVFFVLAGLAVLFRGLYGLWGAEIRGARDGLIAWYRRLRAVRPPVRIAGALPGEPPDQNLLFRDREADLQQLRARLLQQRRVDLSGLGGVGKSQIALEYLHRHHEDYPDGVFWLRGETSATLSGDVAALAWLPTLKLEQREQREQKWVIEAVIGWLSINESWLLVVDNLDVVAAPSLKRLLVPGLGGHVLVTSRVPVWDLDPLAVKPWPPKVARAFLLERSGQKDAAAAAAVAEALGGLPLALAQAGGYLKTSGRDLASYGQLMRTRLGELMREGKPQDYPRTVVATWQVSFERIHREQPAAIALLRLCAFLAPDDIPVSVLAEGARALPKELRRAASDAVRMDRAIGELQRYALIDRHGDSLSVHRLVQTAVRDSLLGDLGERWLVAAVDLLGGAFPADADEPERWPRCARLLPHAQVVLGWVGDREVAPVATSRLLDRAGSYLEARGEFALAQPLYERALAIRERVHGPNHPDTATSLDNLANLLQFQGDLAAAKPLLERALGIRQRVLGPDHPDTAGSLNHLASLLKDEGELAAAQPLYERALAIFERVRGPDHPDTAWSLSILGSLRQAQGELAAAQPLHERALAIRERVQGPDHPAIAWSLKNLGSLRQEQGELAAAQDLYERALAMFKRVLGPDHFDTARSLNDLARLFQAQGDLAAAKALFERALAIRERVLGPEHPTTAVSLNHLAVVLRDQGEPAAARPLFERALTIQERVLGPDHPYTASVRANLQSLRGGLE